MMMDATDQPLAIEEYGLIGDCRTDAYAATGRREEAHCLFERLPAQRNDLDLLSEEFDVRAGRQVGNFPQAFPHLALVRTTLGLYEAAAP
jgi:GH15 family glucan-1,4-alpha-glucosidase